MSHASVIELGVCRLLTCSGYMDTIMGEIPTQYPALGDTLAKNEYPETMVKMEYAISSYFSQHSQQIINYQGMKTYNSINY